MSDRLKRNLLICILSVLVVFALLKTMSVVEDRWGHDASIRWVGLGWFTLAVFALFAAKSDGFINSGRFWSVTVVLLLVHLVAFVTLLSRVDEWKLPWFMVMVFEYPLFLAARDKFASQGDR